MTWEKKFYIRNIYDIYVHFRIFAFTCIYSQSCLFENQWNLDKDRRVGKWNVSFFKKKGGSDLVIRGVFRTQLEGATRGVL